MLGCKPLAHDVLAFCPAAASLAISIPTFVASPDPAIAPGTVNLTVTDTDRIGDGIIILTVTIGPDSETLILIETPGLSGIFKLTVPVNINPGGIVVDDGTITAALAGEQATGTYISGGPPLLESFTIIDPPPEEDESMMTSAVIHGRGRRRPMVLRRKRRIKR